MINSSIFHIAATDASLVSGMAPGKAEPSGLTVVHALKQLMMKSTRNSYVIYNVRPPSYKLVYKPF